MPVVIDFKNAKELSKSIKNLKKFEKRIDRELEAVTDSIRRNIIKRNITPLIRKLRKYPERRNYPVDYPIEWTSEKQRRYVMMMLKGKPYKRTHGIARGWRYKAIVRNDRLTVNITNVHKGTKYVVGSWGRSDTPRARREYMKPMQKFHGKTGWKPVHVPINAEMKKVNEYVKQQYLGWFAKLLA